MGISEKYYSQYYYEEQTMPKFLIAIITGAFALVIGFTCGALLTRPNNIIMDKLVNEQKVLQEKLNLSADENTKLKDQLSKTKMEEEKLKNDLLKALRENRSSSLSEF